MYDIDVRTIKKIKHKCLCCGREFELEPYIEQDFCNGCFPIVCREVFNRANDEITVKEIKEIIKTKTIGI